MSKKKVQTQFGRSAAAYAVSPVHAKGASLARLVELIQPQPDWSVLDVATAAGHTALVFAARVAHVVATDITPEMLSVAAGLAEGRKINNLSLAVADAEALPFANVTFHLVTCRIAPHHFPDVARFVAESARVLCPGAFLAVVDNVVPGREDGRNKKARQRAEDAGRYLNAFEKLRDPSHHRCLSLGEWERLFAAAGLTLTHQETAAKAIDFDDWVARMQVPAAGVVRLRVMLRQAPEDVAGFLAPQFTGERITFHLTEAILIGAKEPPA